MGSFLRLSLGVGGDGVSGHVDSGMEGDNADASGGGAWGGVLGEGAASGGASRKGGCPMQFHSFPSSSESEESYGVSFFLTPSFVRDRASLWNERRYVCSVTSLKKSAWTIFERDVASSRTSYRFCPKSFISR